MATYSENQVRHLYVANSAVAYNSSTAKHLAANAANGAVMVRPDGTGKSFFFECKNALGEVLRSDLIKKSNILSATLTPATKMQRKLTAKQIVPTAVVAGYDYYVRATFRQYVGITDADTYAKYASAHAATGATVKGILAQLAVSMAKSLAPEVSKLLEVKLLVTAGSFTGAVSVTKTTSLASLTGNYVALALCEVEQPWIKGMMTSEPVLFDIVGNESGQDSTGKNVYEEWGTVTDITDTYAAISGNTIGNGKKMADFEYFHLGERGDQYRVVDPYSPKTEGLIDASKTYDTIEIHYYTDECGTNNAKSEKDIVIACPTDNSNAVVLALAGYINTVAGTLLPTSL